MLNGPTTLDGPVETSVGCPGLQESVDEDYVRLSCCDKSLLGSCHKARYLRLCGLICRHGRPCSHSRSLIGRKSARCVPGRRAMPLYLSFLTLYPSHPLIRFLHVMLVSTVCGFFLSSLYVGLRYDSMTRFDSSWCSSYIRVYSTLELSLPSESHKETGREPV